MARVTFFVTSSWSFSDTLAVQHVEFIGMCEGRLSGTQHASRSPTASSIARPTDGEGEMLGRIAGSVRFKEPLSFHTALRIGGSAEFFVAPNSLDDLRYALAFAEQEELPTVVLGDGNNVLVSEQGLQAVVLKLQGVLSRAEFHGDEVAVGAGMSLSALIREAAAHDLGGLECLAGIPATVGGALANNVGTRDGSLMDFCSAVSVLNPDGTLGEFRPSGHATPGQIFELAPGSIFVGCRLRLVRRRAQDVLKDVRQRLKLRKLSQPFVLAAAGYIWKDPPGDRAARLVEAVGLRGKRVNGAEISAKSGNLIVNRGGATQGDVLALMEMTRQRVESRFGTTLQPGIRLVGFPRPLPLAAEHLELIAGR